MSKHIKFNNYFKINLNEEQLDFVNIPLNTDLLCYIDPYAISKTTDEWGTITNNTIVDYFEKLIKSIKKGDEVGSYRLLNKLNEPNETHFGLSSQRPDGCGIGNLQAQSLYMQLKNSKAMRTGYLKDLSDCELLIEGIGADKISDMTTNIIRGKLVEYTEEQCKIYGIPVRKVKTGYYWSLENSCWEKRFAHLPFYSNKPVILVPKRIARKKTISNYRNFYEAIIEQKQAEHLDLNTSLVKLLKNGKRIVYKKDLKAIYKCTKAFILECVEKEPKILEKYKKRNL